MLFDFHSLQNWPTAAQIGNCWVPARPLRAPFVWRVRLAWGVLTGKYDALRWPAGQ